MNLTAPSTRHGASAQSGARLASSQKTLPATFLFKGKRVVELVHNGETYRLSLNRSDKLILTK